MSIVISVVEQNRTFYIASDRRRTLSGGISHDDCQKIYPLRPSVYFAITGIAELGLYVLDLTRKLGQISTSELLAGVDRIVVPVPHKLTVMIAGQGESGEFFIWQKTNQGERKIADIRNDNIAYSVSSNDKIDKFTSYFENLLGDFLAGRLGMEEAIGRTIVYASQIDVSISPTHDLFKLESGGFPGQ